MIRGVFILFAIYICGYKLHAECYDRYQTPIFEEFIVSKDILFGSSTTSSNKTKDLYLDFYSGKGDLEPLRPLLIFVHGGSFLGGNKDIPETVRPCQEMALRGYAAASIQYRLEENPLSLINPELMIKAVIRAGQDVRAAIRFFYKQAKIEGNPYRIDTNQIFVGGASAGSIAVLHTIYMDQIEELEKNYIDYVKDLGGLEGNSGNPGYSSKVKGVINVSGCLRDVRYMDNNNIPLLSIHHNSDPTIPGYFGRPYYLPTLPTVYGSFSIQKHANKIGVYNMLYKVMGKGHIPYVDGNTPIQPVYDSTMTVISQFMYSLLDCNPNKVITSILTPRPVSELSIYPNPTNGYIVIGEQNVDLRQVSSIRIIDMLGTIRAVVNDNNLILVPIDLISLGINDGLYIIEALDKKNNILAQQRMVVKR